MCGIVSICIFSVSMTIFIVTVLHHFLVFFKRGSYTGKRSRWRGLPDPDFRLDTSSEKRAGRETPLHEGEHHGERNISCKKRSG